jgi:Spy/CpxP family protein refolding chaperone
MRRLAQVGLTVAVAALLACPALAQQQQRQRQGGGRGQGGGGGGALVLLRDKGVQQDLKLTDDQVKAIDAAAKKQADAMTALRGGDPQEARTKMQEITKETTKTINDTLKADQKKRLGQLELQQRGLSALAAPARPNAPPSTLAKDLNVTEDQQKKIQDIVAGNREKMRDIFQNAQGDREGAAKKMAELNKETNQKIEGILTAEQKTKWKEMTGEPYKGTLPSAFGGFGTGRRPGGGGGNARPPV